MPKGKLKGLFNHCRHASADNPFVVIIIDALN